MIYIHHKKFLSISQTRLAGFGSLHSPSHVGYLQQHRVLSMDFDCL